MLLLIELIQSAAESDIGLAERLDKAGLASQVVGPFNLPPVYGDTVADQSVIDMHARLHQFSELNEEIRRHGHTSLSLHLHCNRGQTTRQRNNSVISTMSPT